MQTRGLKLLLKDHVLEPGTALAFDDDLDREVSFLSIILTCSLTNRA